MLEYLVLVLVCIIGAILQATLGFGFPIFANLILIYFFPLPTTITIVQFVGLLGVGYFFFKYFKCVKWKVLLPFLLVALPVGLFFTWYSSKISVSSLKIYLGIMLACIGFFLCFISDKVTLKPNVYSGMGMGAVSGLLNGVFAVGGPPVALYMLPSVPDNISYIATVNAYYFIFKAFSLPLRMANGSVGKEHIGYLLVGLLSMTLGTVIGDRVIKKVSNKMLKKLVYGFVCIAGLIIVLQEMF